MLNCVLQVDALAAKRSEGGGGGGGGGGEASVRLLSTLLTEMDGMEMATGEVGVGGLMKGMGVMNGWLDGIW